jgi:hypothetical protein
VTGLKNEMDTNIKERIDEELSIEKWKQSETVFTPASINIPIFVC